MSSPHTGAVRDADSGWNTAIHRPSGPWWQVELSNLRSIDSISRGVPFPRSLEDITPDWKSLTAAQRTELGLE
jgi:hypothetical protein